MKKESEDNRFFKKIEERRKLRVIGRKRKETKPMRKSAVLGKISRVFLIGLSGLMFHHTISVVANQ